MFSSWLQNSKVKLIGAIVGVSLLVGIIVFVVSCQSNAPLTSNTSLRNTTSVPTPSIRAEFPAAYFSPYVDVTASNNPFALVNEAEQQANGDVHFFTLAFITARAGCQATWGGVTIPDAQHPYLLENIRNLRANGGDITISFGGPVASQGIEQQDLAQACQTASSLRQQYQNIINLYQLTHIDFLLEGSLLSDANSIQLRNQALAGLKAGLPDQPLTISYTLPITPQGLDQTGYAFLQSTLQAHVAIKQINFLVQDFARPENAEPVSHLIEQAMGNISQQMLRMQLNDNLAYLPSMGITPLIGQGTDTTESFTLADAQELLAFASAHRQEVSELSMWSLQRDQPCKTSAPGFLLDNCSGLTQKSFDFTRILNAFPLSSAEAAPTPMPTPEPTPTPTPVPTQTGQPTATPLPPTPTPHSGNLLVNPTFNGLTGWNCETPDIAQNNTLRILPTSTTNGKCTQTITGLQPNHTYTLQAYVRGSYAYMQAGSQVQSVFSTDYTLLQLSFTTGSATSVTVALYADIAQPEVDVQNVSLQ
jgi:hypothetical protein